MDTVLLRTVGIGVSVFIFIFLIMYYSAYKKLNKKEQDIQKILEYCLVPSTFIGMIMGGGYYYYNLEPKIELSNDPFWSN